ncbi:MAG: TVP38/TMEM64 family protein [Oscillospiraceae bacterium]
MRQKGPFSREKLRAAAAVGLFAAAALLLCLLVGVPMLRFASRPEEFRAWVDSHGVGGRLAYMGMVLLQVVVAIIPGEPLEIAAGYAFGALEGTLLCLLAATLGSVVVFWLVRRFGVRLAELFFSREKLQSLHFLKTTPRRDFLFLLIFMLPGTPKDLLCYFAGLTDIRFPVWLLICSVGRIPSVVTSTVGGNALGTQSYVFAAAVFAAALLISAAGLRAYRRICRRRGRSDTEEQSPPPGGAEPPSHGAE